MSERKKEKNQEAYKDIETCNHNLFVANIKCDTGKGGNSQENKLMNK